MKLGDFVSFLKLSTVRFFLFSRLRLTSTNIIMILFLYASTAINNQCGVQKAGQNPSEFNSQFNRCRLSGDLHKLLVCFMIPQ